MCASGSYHEGGIAASEEVEVRGVDVFGVNERFVED
jgi:hypothetical protein